MAGEVTIFIDHSSLPYGWCSHYLQSSACCPMVVLVMIFIDLSPLPMAGDVTIFIDHSPMPYGW